MRQEAQEALNAGAWLTGAVWGAIAECGCPNDDRCINCVSNKEIADKWESARAALQRKVEEPEQPANKKLPSTVWIVGGSQGSYADAREWPLAAYSDESEARALVAHLTALVASVPRWNITCLRGEDGVYRNHAVVQGDELDVVADAILQQIAAIDPMATPTEDPTWGAFPMELDTFTYSEKSDDV